MRMRPIAPREVNGASSLRIQWQTEGAPCPHREGNVAIAPLFWEVDNCGFYDYLGRSRAPVRSLRV